MKFNKFLFILILIFPFLPSIYCQNRPLTIDDLATWQYIKSSKISPTGQWVSYEIDAEEGDPSVHFYNVEGGKTYSFPISTDPKVSNNEKWAAFKIQPPELVIKELKRSKIKEDKMPLDTLAIFSFSDKSLLKFAGVQSYELPDSLPDFLVYETSAPFHSEDSTMTDPYQKRDEDNGFHLVIRQISLQKSDTIFFAKKWKLSKYGNTIIAQTTAKDSTDTDKWITYHVETGERNTIYDGKGLIKQYVLSADGARLGICIDFDTTKSYERDYHIHLAPYNQAIDSGKTTYYLFKDLNDHYEINPHHPLSFSKDGQRLFLNYHKIPKFIDTLLLEEEIVDVEIWTTQDPLIYPQQNKKISEQLKEGLPAIVDENNTIRLIGINNHPSIIYSKDKIGDFTINYNNKKYQKYITWEGHDYKDVYAYDIKSKSSWKIIDSLYGYPQFSPSGNWAYWWNYNESAWYGYDMVNREMYQWTSDKKGTFYNELHDYPSSPWSYGVMGFSDDENTVFIYDRYDIWKVRTHQDIKLKRITKGRKNKLKYRNINLDKENPYIPNDANVLLYLFSEETKQSGYALMDMESCKIQELVLEDAQYNRMPKKASKDNAILFTKESYESYPDLRISSGFNFSNGEIITNLNPQQKDYYWGNISLVHWTLNGKKQEGMLILPDNFDPNKKYPLLVNFYEKSSNGLHRHRRPYLHRSTINYPYYASQGYVIFNPDIHYTVGDPGLSATKTVISGVEHLLKLGYIDKDRMALQGHSWGGYQIAHILTQTDIFRCAESGAPVVNMTSAYGGIRWGSGMSRMFQYEKSQSRLGKTLWESPETYIRNSPLFALDKMVTPVLILHNDQDGAVPWYQGIEYYMGLRRLGKDAWLLNYKGEPHWPLKFQNRKDFQTRMSQFFNYYLKGKDLPEWMKNGVPAHERKLNLGY